jgi:hypothetical protein
MFSLSHPIQNALGGRDEVGVVTFFSARKTILLVPRVRAQCAKNEVWQDAVSRNNSSEDKKIGVELVTFELPIQMLQRASKWQLTVVPHDQIPLRGRSTTTTPAVPRPRRRDALRHLPAACRAGRYGTTCSLARLIRHTAARAEIKHLPLPDADGLLISRPSPPLLCLSLLRSPTDTPADAGAALNSPAHPLPRPAAARPETPGLDRDPAMEVRQL